MKPPALALKLELLPPAQHIATGLHKISLAIRSQTWQQAGQRGLTPTQAQILVVLQTREAQGAKTTLSEAAEALAVTTATASDAVATLMAKHLVAKQKDAEDARAVLLRLTSKGKRAARRAALWSDFLLAAAQTLSPEEQAVFLRALVKMIRHMQEQGQIPVSRMCVTCRFFRPHVHADPERPHHCDFVDAPFGDRHLRLECPDHEAASPSAASHKPSAAKPRLLHPLSSLRRRNLMSQTAAPGHIPGYSYGTDAVHKSPITLQELELLKQTVLFTDEDVKYLRLSGEVLKDQVEQVLDVWYGFVGSHPHLLHYFTRKTDGQPDAEYLAAVRKRFGQWILDTAAAQYDQKWLDYQYEIGLRHHRSAKNQTDRVDSVENIHYRYLPTLIYPITYTLKPFLAKKGHAADEVEKMHQAWIKSVILQVTLWSQPYVKDGDF